MTIRMQPLHSALIASTEGELAFGYLFQSQKHAAFILVYPILWVRSSSLIKQRSSRNKSHWPLGHKGKNNVLPQTTGREHVWSCQALWDTMLNFCGITSVWQNWPHKSLPCCHAYPVSAQPVESHPVFFLHPDRGCFPASDSPAKPSSAHSRKPAELGSKGCSETFPPRMQMIHMCIPLQVSEFAHRWRRAGCYHKNLRKPLAWEVLKWAPGGGEPRADVDEHLSYMAWLICTDTADHGWGHDLPRCRDVLFLLRTPWAFGRDVGDQPARTQSTSIRICRPQSGTS